MSSPASTSEATHAVRAAERAYQLFEVGLTAFRCELIREDAAAQEVEAERAIDALQEYFDQMMVANALLRTRVEKG